MLAIVAQNSSVGSCWSPRCFLSRGGAALKSSNSEKDELSFISAISSQRRTAARLLISSFGDVELPSDASGDAPSLSVLYRKFKQFVIFKFSLGWDFFGSLYFNDSYLTNSILTSGVASEVSCNSTP